MLGCGKYYDSISKKIKQRGLGDYVYQLGAVPANEVREYMNLADIFIFTSNRREGWGAVLNESMNSGCAVVANEKIGSAKSIILNGQNGLTYKSKKQFKRALLYLANDETKRKELGKNAYDAVVGEWSAQCAADRFYDVAIALLNGSEAPNYLSGPMKKMN